jgi:hypothetical protein
MTDLQQLQDVMSDRGIDSFTMTYSAGMWRIRWHIDAASAQVADSTLIGCLVAFQRFLQGMA